MVLYYTIVLLFLFVGPMLVQVYLPLCPAVFFSANKFDLITFYYRYQRVSWCPPLPQGGVVQAAIMSNYHYYQNYLEMYLVLEVININCKKSFHYNFRKFSFAARVVNVWNSLPYHVVDVNSLKQFETRLDKFWSNQDVMFDCRPLK